MSFPPATEMFQFAGFASPTYEFSRRSPIREGLPHSEIQGSTIARISPWLIAACHVLHRLSVPRHPPNALSLTLDRKTHRLQDKAPQGRQVSHEDTLPKNVSSIALEKTNTTADVSSAFPKCSSANRLDNKRRQTLLRLLHSSLCQRSQTPAFADRRIVCFTRSIFGFDAGLPTEAADLTLPSSFALQASGDNLAAQRRLVEVNWIEPMTSCLQSRRSPN